MSAWPRQPIASLGTVTTGSTPRTSEEHFYGGDIPFVTPAELDQIDPIMNAARTLSESGSQEARLLPEGTVMVCCIGSLGKVGIAGRTVASNQQINSVIFDPRLIWSRFGFYACRLLKSRLQTLAPATTVAIVNKSKFEQLEIPVPPLQEQRRIADILDRAEALRAKRLAALAQLDELAKSTYIDLFGNPTENKKNWPLAKLESVASVERGKFTPRPRNDPSYYGGKFPFIQTGDISNSLGRVTSWNQTLNEKGVKVSRNFPPGTVVIAIVGATIGVTSILDVEVYCPDSVVGIQVYPDKATAEYVEHMLRFWRPIFISQAPETARANINLETLRPLRIPIPPIALQQEFTRQILAIERIKTTYRASLSELDNLFASLQYRAFRGEL
jgi:type I restriction enzyme, S subunit